MTHLARVAVVTALAFPFSTGIGHAASQTILGSKFLVKNPGVATKRKVTGSAKESGSPNTIVGNPTTGGASLRVIANGGTDSDPPRRLPGDGGTGALPPRTGLHRGLCPLPAAPPERLPDA